MLKTKIRISTRARQITDKFSSGSWKNKRCFILGGGPILQGFKFIRLENELTIGVNKTFMQFPVTLNYSMDLKFYNLVIGKIGQSDQRTNLQEAWKNYRGIKVFLDPSAGIPDKSIYIVRRRKDKSLTIDLIKGIYGGNNSGFGAIQLAAALGANPIYLLGYDLKVDKASQKTHWHNGYRETVISEFARKLNNFKECFEDNAVKMIEAGVEVINLTPNSALNHYPKKDFLEII